MDTMCIHILCLTLLKRLGTFMAAKPCPGALPAAWMDVRKVPRCASHARSVSYVYVRATDRPCGALRDAGPSADSTSSCALASVTPACQLALSGFCTLTLATCTDMSCVHFSDREAMHELMSCVFYPPHAPLLLRTFQSDAQTLSMPFTC